MPLSVSDILEIVKARGFILKEGGIEELFREVFGDGIKILPPREPKTCYACGGTLFWISKLNSHLVCATCHPPSDPSIVAGWYGKPKEQESYPEAETRQIDYQKPICMWCSIGKSLDCPDCGGKPSGKSSKG